MPTDPNYIHADVSHPKMVVGNEWRYGCHSDKVGNEPRGMVRQMWVQDGWVVDLFGNIGCPTRFPRMVLVETKWNPVICGHVVEVNRGPDSACKGCVREQS